MENKRAHLNMIQGVINRLANSSFLLKGWTVILVAGLFALTARDLNESFTYFAYFPAIAFWVLDGYFLWQERLYRRLFDIVREKEKQEIDFSMDTSSMRGEVKTWSEAIFSKTLLVFHGTIFVTVTVVMLIVVWVN